MVLMQVSFLVSLSRKHLDQNGALLGFNSFTKGEIAATISRNHCFQSGLAQSPSRQLVEKGTGKTEALFTTTSYCMRNL